MRPPLSRGLLVALVLVAGAAWRLWLGTRYAGWEESDYGNLAMVHGVLEGGFVHYDMNHLPGYYALSAAVLALVGDAVLAARAVSLAGGLVALGLSVAVTDRLAGRRAALWTAAVLVLQPEFALYAASSLREPVYAAFVVGSVAALTHTRLTLAGVLAAGAFFVRFDALLVLGPVLLVEGATRRQPLRGLAPLLAAAVIWSTYTWWDHGTPYFWSHAVAVNVETGLGSEAQSTLDWWRRGLGVSATLVGWVLPWRVGWAIGLGALVGLGSLRWVGKGPLRPVVLTTALLVGLWAGIGLTGQHDPDHNLYWKWMLPLVPFVVPLGVVGALGAVDRLVGTRSWVAAVVTVTLATQGLLSNVRETERQVTLSQTLYAPQLALARWVEAEVPESLPLVLDNIPACWIDRRSHSRMLHSWYDIPAAADNPDRFGAWLKREGVGWVLWFREDWTQAPGVAPFLSGGGTWRGAGMTLTEAAREDAYGWILYRVEGVGTASLPPSLAGPTPLR